MSRPCTVCQPQHRDGQGDECDHWCHGAGAEDWNVQDDPREDGEQA